MAYITFAVTKDVLRQVEKAGNSQRLLAIKDASPELLKLIRMASKKTPVSVSVNGIFELLVADTGAIWGTHQVQDLQAADFASLYDLLARRPDVKVRFTWDDDK